MFYKALIAVFVFFSTNAMADGIEFFKGTWKEAMEMAQKEDKILFIDSYTKWCGPCKRMAKYVFTEASVGEFYNENFINLKLDMESADGMTFKLKYPVSAYPTFFYLKPNGDVLHKAKGGRKPAQFIDLGKKALSKYDNSSEYRKKYKDGDRSYNVVYNYIKALNKSGKSPIQVANEYLESQSDLNSEENLKLIFEAAVEVDSRIFGLMQEKKADIIDLVGQEAYSKKVALAAENTIKKSIEYKYPELLEEAILAYSSENKEDELNFEYTSRMNYHAALGNEKEYVKYTKKYISKVAKKDARLLNSAVENVLQKFGKSEDALKLAEKAGYKASEYGGQSKYYYNLGLVLMSLEKKEEALNIAKKGMKIAEESDSDTQKLTMLIHHLENS